MKSAGGESRHLESPEGDATRRKKKHSLVVIIIALIVAFLCVDGIIYAAFALR
jgi:flagellar basal body-associated protein FliL